MTVVASKAILFRFWIASSLPLLAMMAMLA